MRRNEKLYGSTKQNQKTKTKKTQAIQAGSVVAVLKCSTQYAAVFDVCAPAFIYLLFYYFIIYAGSFQRVHDLA